MLLSQENEDRLIKAVEDLQKLSRAFSKDGKAIATATLAAAVVSKLDNPSVEEAAEVFNDLWRELWSK